MYNTLVISVIMTVLPMLAVVFVVGLLMHKLYVLIRSNYNTHVNCWFCNANTTVPYTQKNSWMCPACEQYNGFAKDGGYNREMQEQLDCSNISNNSSNNSMLQDADNGFCSVCNEAQRLKVEKLAQFEPKNETHFDAELKTYKDKLEEQYRLCVTCDRHLKRVLREKKKMVLGSKFLEYLLRGANIMQQPHLANVRSHQKRLWKQRLTTCITICCITNICCLFWSMNYPEFTKARVTKMFGNYVGEYMFQLGTLFVDNVRVGRAYIESVSGDGIALKVRLFCRTIFLMLLYSLGLKWPRLMRVNFSSVIMLISPYLVLALAFVHNALDGFVLTRYTLLIGVWGIVSPQLLGVSVLSNGTIMLIASVLTFCLTVRDRKILSSKKLLAEKPQAFHRMYSDELLSECDEDTLDILSEKLNTSRVSRGSGNSVKTTANFSTSTRFCKSPLTASMHSLNTQPLGTSLHNKSFHSYLPQNSHNNYNFTQNPPYAGSVFGFNTQVPQVAPPYASHMDLRTTTAYNLPQMQRPCFGTTNQLYQHTKQPPLQNRGLLSPSRFNGNGLGNGRRRENLYLYGKETQLPLPKQQQRFTVGSVLYEARDRDNLSRGSSHSSGFESQAQEREPSCGRETAYEDFSHYAAGLPRDSFNFQQIDAQLPSLMPGDLLRKWKETQIMT